MQHLSVLVPQLRSLKIIGTYFFKTVRTTTQLEIVLFVLLLCVRSPVGCPIRRMVTLVIMGAATSLFVGEVIRALATDVIQASPALSIWIAKFIAILPFQLPVSCRVKRLISLVNKALSLTLYVLRFRKIIYLQHFLRLLQLNDLLCELDARPLIGFLLTLRCFPLLLPQILTGRSTLAIFSRELTISLCRRNFSKFSLIIFVSACLDVWVIHRGKFPLLA